MQAEVTKYRREKRSKLLFQTGKALTVIAAVMIAAASALPLLAQSPGHAELHGGSTPQPPTTITSLPNRTLRKTHFYVLGQDLAVEAACNTSGCQATAPVFTAQIQCPGIAGKTCTYHIQVSAQVSVTPNDFGEYRLLVDGAPPVQFRPTSRVTLTGNSKTRIPVLGFGRHGLTQLWEL